MKPAASPRAPGGRAPVIAAPGPVLTPSVPFNAFLFLAGVGGMFFRMARDNDDLVRMVLVLVAGAGFALTLAGRGARLRASLALPALGYAAATLYASFDAINPSESLKEFLKIGVYLLLYLALASRAADAPVPGSPARRRWIAAGFALAGLWLGWYHAHSAVAPVTFRLWSDNQVIASLATTGFFCVAFCLWLAEGTVRQSVLRGGLWMAIAACAIGVFQFYGVDPLRPWDPRQPYDIYLSGWAANLVSIVSPGVFRLDPDGSSVLVLPRILGIYGNPDFFAPYLLQFVPMALAVTVLDRARRWTAAAMAGALLLTLGLTDVTGAWFALVLLMPVLGALFGFVHGPLGRDAASGRLIESVRPFLPTLQGLGVATVALFVVSRITHDILTTLFLLSFAATAGYVGWLAGRVFRDRIVQVTFITVGVGVILLTALGVFWYQTGHKSAAINERLVKYLMATAMWRTEPVHGIGVNAYKSWYPAIQQSVRLPRDVTFEELGSSFTQENRTHNDILQLIAETGVLGSGMFVWFMAALLWNGYQRLRRDEDLTQRDRADIAGLMGGVLVILIYALPNFPFHIVSSAGTFWVMAGLLASYGEAPHEPLAPRLRLLLLPAAVAFVAFMAIFNWHLFLGTLDYKRADFFSVRIKPPEPEKAAWHYERALARDPNNAQYAYDFGAMCFNNLTQIPALGAKAEPMLGLARDLGFLNEDLEYGLGFIAERQGRYDEALDHYLRACGLNERHQPSREGRMRMLLRTQGPAETALAQRRYRQARQLYRDSLKKDPENYALMFKYGSLSVTPFNDMAEGLAWLERAAVAARNEPTFWLTLGRAQASAGKLDEAQRSLRQALLLNVQNPEIKAALEQVTQMLKARGETPPPAPGGPHRGHVNEERRREAERDARADPRPRPARRIAPVTPTSTP